MQCMLIPWMHKGKGRERQMASWGLPLYKQAWENEVEGLMGGEERKAFQVCGGLIRGKPENGRACWFLSTECAGRRKRAGRGRLEL